MAQEAKLCFRTRTSHQNLIAGHRREFHKIVKEGPTIPSRTFMQAPLTQSIFKIFMQGPLLEGFNRISTRSSHNDIYKIRQGHLESFSTASSTLSYKGLHKITQRPLTQDFTRIFTTPSHRRFYKILQELL